MNRARQRCVAWLALLATLLYALWPLLATAQPRNGDGAYELCPHHLLQQFAPQNGDSPAKPLPAGYQDPLQCAFGLGIGDGASMLATAALVFSILPASESIDPTAIFAVECSLLSLAALPRGPPAIS